MYKIISKPTVIVASVIAVIISVSAAVHANISNSATSVVRPVKNTSLSTKTKSVTATASPVVQEATNDGGVSIANNAPAPTTKKTTNVTAVTSTPASTSVAITAPAPVAVPASTKPTAPSFQLQILASSAYDFQSPFMPGIKQRIVPFTIKTNSGFIATEYQQPGCRFIKAPTSDHGLLCNVAEKEANGGTLSAQYNDASPCGHYAIEMTYFINTIQQSAVYEFDL